MLEFCRMLLYSATSLTEEITMTHYYISYGYTDLEVAVKPGTDLDGTFEATCLDTGEALNINGWMIDHIELLN